MRRLLLFIFGVLLFSSCQENIDFDLNTEQSRLVVDGGITDEKKRHMIKLTKTVSFYESEAAQGVTNANVTISDGSSTFQLVHETDGEYYTVDSIQGIPGNTYTLRVSYDGNNYEASEFMHPVIAIDTVQALKEDGFDFEENVPIDVINIYLFATESEGLGDYYLWKYQVKKPDTAWKDMTPRYRDWTYASDEFVDGRSPTSGWLIFAFIDESEIPPNSIVRLEMGSISKEYYDYLDALGQQVFRGGLFDGPPANVPTNVSNGAMGYFSASSVTYSETVTNYD